MAQIPANLMAWVNKFMTTPVKETVKLGPTKEALVAMMSATALSANAMTSLNEFLIQNPPKKPNKRHTINNHLSEAGRPELHRAMHVYLR